MRTILLLAGCALVGACVAPSARHPAAGSVPALTSQWVAGGWVIAGESCDSDAGVIYGTDGRWLAEGVAGTWQVKRGRLIETVLEREANGGVMRPLSEPVRYVEDIEILGADEFIARRGDGAERHFHRCRTGSEPER